MNILSFFGPVSSQTPHGMYSLDHLILFLIFTSLIIIGLIFFRKINKEQIRKLTLIFAIVITILEIMKFIYHAYYHNLNSLDSWVPLHYCSLFIYALWCASSKNKIIKRIGSVMLTTGCMLAGMSYLCYPSTSLTFVGAFHFLSFHAFLYHSSMVFLGLLYLITGYYKPKFKDFIYYLIFVTFFAIIALIIDYSLKVNLMFLYDDYMLPNFIHQIFLFSRYLYTLCAYIAYLSIFFVPTFIITIINRREINNVKNFSDL